MQYPQKTLLTYQMEGPPVAVTKISADPSDPPITEVVNV